MSVNNLCSAIYQRMHGLVITLMQQNPNHVNDRDLTGYTPLTMAIANRDLECARILLLGGPSSADVDMMDSRNVSPLAEACFQHDLRIVRDLLCTWRASADFPSYNIDMSVSPLRRLFITAPSKPGEVSDVNEILEMLLHRKAPLADAQILWSAALTGNVGAVKRIKAAMDDQELLGVVGSAVFAAKYEFVLHMPEIIDSLRDSLRFDYVMSALNNHQPEIAVRAAKNGGTLNISFGPISAALRDVIFRAVSEGPSKCSLKAICVCGSRTLCSCKLKAEAFMGASGDHIPSNHIYSPSRVWQCFWRINGVPAVVLAFYMASHERVGLDSPASLLDSHVMSMIAKAVSSSIRPMTIYANL